MKLYHDTSLPENRADIDPRFFWFWQEASRSPRCVWKGFRGEVAQQADERATEKEAKGAPAAQSKEVRAVHSGQDGPSLEKGLAVEGI